MTDDSSLRKPVQCESTELAHAAATAQNSTAKEPNLVAGNPLLLTVLSAIAFFVVGAWAWSPKFALLLFPILLLHELGHFAAMKRFGYQEVRLFFVPLLGAAVAGRSKSGSISQKIIVSLAGPIPGIMVAAMLWFSGVTATHPTANAVAIMLLAVNGFNLLPILPLDGGWLVQTLLAKRPWLEFAFRCITILLLLVIAITTKAWIIAVIAIPSASRLYSALHLCRIQSQLLKANPTRSPITDDKILQQVRLEFPGAILTDKTAEQWLQRIHQLINEAKLKRSVVMAICFLLLVLIAGSGAIMWNLLEQDRTENRLQPDPWQHEY
ncbi:MAG: site-2 protease family protein [Fuerstiella sp.]